MNRPPYGLFPGEIEMLQLLRRMVQLSVIVFLMILPILALYAMIVEHRMQRMIDVQYQGPWLVAFKGIDAFFSRYDQSTTMGLIGQVKGSIWAVDIFGLRLSDPLAFLSHLFAAKSFDAVLFVSIIIPIGLTMFLGRFFCSWICPMNTFLELNNTFRGLLKSLRFVPHNVTLDRRYKYWFLGMILMAALISGISLLPMIYPPIVLSREIFYYLFYGGFGVGIFFILSIAVVELSLSERMWCRYLCPGGALWSLVGSKKILNIERDRETCTDCHECDINCEFSLEPMKDKFGRECSNCGECISVCPEDSLSWKLGRAS